MKDKQTNKMHLAQENIYIEKNIDMQRNERKEMKISKQIRHISQEQPTVSGLANSSLMK